jgi:hypothetical protein
MAIRPADHGKSTSIRQLRAQSMGAGVGQGRLRNGVREDIMSFSHENTERFRVATKNQTIYVHAKKHCACGRQVSAKQLAQYGKCDSCFKAGK